MQLRTIVQQEYPVELKLKMILLHVRSIYMLTLFSLHVHSRLQHLQLGIHETLMLELLKHS